MVSSQELYCRTETPPVKNRLPHYRAELFQSCQQSTKYSSDPDAAHRFLRITSSSHHFVNVRSRSGDARDVTLLRGGSALKRITTTSLVLLLTAIVSVEADDTRPKPAPTSEAFSAESIPAYGGTHDDIYQHIDRNVERHLGNLQRWVRK
jgi:hypothetical protein